MLMQKQQCSPRVCTAPAEPGSEVCLRRSPRRAAIARPPRSPSRAGEHRPPSPGRRPAPGRAPPEPAAAPRLAPPQLPEPLASGGLGPWAAAPGASAEGVAPRREPSPDSGELSLKH